MNEALPSFIRTARTVTWNTCEIDKDAPGIDDVRFLTALADKFIVEAGSDRNRVFAVGLSEGGYMAIRLALEAPSRFRACGAGRGECFPCLKTFIANRSGMGGTSVILIHGTKASPRPLRWQRGERTIRPLQQF